MTWRSMVRLKVCEVATGLLVLGGAPLQAFQTVVERSDAESIVFTLDFDSTRTREMEIDGRVWQAVSVPACDETDVVGWPATPQRTLLVAIPPDARIVSVDAEPLETRRFSGAPIRPVPRPLVDPEDRSRVGRWITEPAWGDRAGIFPAERVELLDVFWWRNRRVAAFRVAPVRTRPGESGFEFTPRMRLRLRLASGGMPADKPLRARYGADRMDGLIDAALVNGPESRDWLRTERAPVFRGGRGGADYFWSSPNWVKVVTRGEGIVRVTGSDLSAAGVLGNVSSATLRLFVGEAAELSVEPPQEDPASPPWMMEVPILVEDGGDGVLNVPGLDRIEFYARPVDGYHDWLDPTSEDSTYVIHPYTSDCVYYLTWEGTFSGEPRRFLDTAADVTPDGVPDALIESVTERVHVEENRIFNGLPYEYGVRWEKWWWGQFGRSDGRWQGFAFNLPGHMNGSVGRFLCRLWGLTENSCTLPGHFPDHMVNLKVNGLPFPRQDWNANPTQRYDFDTTGTFLMDGRNTFEISIFEEPDPVCPDTQFFKRPDVVLLAYLEIQHKRALRWTGSDFVFQGPAMTGDLRYRITGLPDTQVSLYDVTDPRSPVLLLGAEFVPDQESYTMEFDRSESATQHRYLITRQTNRRPISVSLNPPPIGGRYLRERRDPVNYIIVYHEAFEAGAQELAELRRMVLHGVENPQVLAVRVSDVYDEFSWGLPDPTAIRNFFKYAYNLYRVDPDSSASLYYGVLFGDADYDHRDYAAADVDYVPAWADRRQDSLADEGYEPSWPSDDYMGLLDNHQEYGMDISVGRIPVQSPQDAQAAVDKIRTHALYADRSTWQQRAVAVADDICQDADEDGLGWTHTYQAESLVDILPPQMEPVKIYLVDYPDPINGLICSAVDKPSARNALVEAINEGAWLVDYVGHGGESVLSDEHVLEDRDVPSMKNAGRYHYLITASCSVGKFDDASEGLAETIVKRAGGGSVNSYSAAAVAYAESNVALNRNLLRGLFGGADSQDDTLVTFGWAAQYALAHTPVVNSRKYNVLGDPANVMVWPAYDCSLEVNNGSGLMRTLTVTDTLWRGQRVTVKGTILDDNRDVVSDFSGTAHLRVIDSERPRFRGGPAVDYRLAGAPIYRGDIPVAEGEFEAEFMVPTGLLREEDRGFAKIRCYVSGAEEDAFGSIDRLVIPVELKPGTVLNDSVGPTITLEFEGPAQAVPITSKVHVRIEDPSGIYITQLLDSRSVIMKFEEPGGYAAAILDLASEIVFQGRYDSAEVDVALPSALTAGEPYTVRVLASDNLGNRSAVAEEIFIVASGVPEVERVHVYPNPAKQWAGFFVDFSLASDIRVSLYTISGRKIRTLAEYRDPGMGRRDPIRWDLRDEDGDRVANGSYHYLMEIRPSDGSRPYRRQGWVAVLR